MNTGLRHHAQQVLNHAKPSGRVDEEGEPLSLVPDEVLHMLRTVLEMGTPGWRMVPVEPSHLMQSAATEVAVDDGRGRKTALNWEEAAEVWANMLDAAPEAPE